MSLDNLVGRTLEIIEPASAVDECILHAENLLHDVNHWLKENKPELID